MDELGDSLISIRPHFADAILSGIKTVELRRRIPSIALGTRLWIYATRPTAAVIGSVVLERIVEQPPEELWEFCGHHAAVDRELFDAYFEGTNVALGLFLTDVRRANPVEIKRLREMRSGFHPPQVIARLTATETKILSNMAREIGFYEHSDAL